MTPILTKNKKRLIKSRYHKIVTPDGRKVDAHRYAMECKLGRRLERWEHVHHKNEDTHDNRLDNLELLTKAEHFRRHGLHQISPILFSGQDSPRSKLTWDQAAEIRQRARMGETNRSLATAFGVGKTTISRIRTGSSYKTPQQEAA